MMGREGVWDYYKNEVTGEVTKMLYDATRDTNPWVKANEGEYEAYVSERAGEDELATPPATAAPGEDTRPKPPTGATWEAYWSGMAGEMSAEIEGLERKLAATREREALSPLGLLAQAVSSSVEVDLGRNKIYIKLGNTEHGFSTDEPITNPTMKAIWELWKYTRQWEDNTAT